MASELVEFIAAAKAHSAQDEFLAALLRQRGWPQKDVQAAFAEYYESRTGLAIPSRIGQGEAARDAFFYLLAFTTLSIWIWGLVSLSFDLLDSWMPDRVVNQGRYYNAFYPQAGDMARILIAFPSFLWIMRSIGKSEAAAGARSSSPVARWLTYISLFLTATTVICDLMVAVEYLLRGELTLRFVIKVMIVLVMASGVFWYFFERLRSRPAAEDGSSGAAAPAPAIRLERALVWAASVATVGVLCAGLANFGGPGLRRKIEADRQRVEDLKVLVQRINYVWTRAQTQPESPRKLPDGLAELSISLGQAPRLHDPQTGDNYEYLPSPAPSSSYQLCATFDLPSSAQANEEAVGFWQHPAGHHCYSLDARREN